MVFCWRRDPRFRAADQPLANTIEFLPVEVRAGDEVATVPAKAEATETRRIEIVLKSGHRVSIEGGFDGAAIAALRANFELGEAELDVARALVEGLSPKAIARLRDRSVETVRKQVRAVFRKTGARSAIDLVHLTHSLHAHLLVTDASQGLAAQTRRLVVGARGAVDVLLDGPRSGRPLLFLHGCLGGRQLMHAARARLGDRLIVAPGRAGHGRTPARPDAAVERPAADAAAVMDALGVRRFDVLAYDVGAAAALALATAMPERLGRVVLVAALPAMPRLADVMALPPQQRVFPILSRLSVTACTALARLGGQKLLADGPDGFGRTVFAGAPADLAACEAPAVATRFWRGHAWHTRCGSAGFVRDAAIAGSAWADRIATKGSEIVFVHGDADRSAQLARVAELLAHSGGRLHTVSGCGHAILHAAPDAWLDVMA